MIFYDELPDPKSHEVQLFDAIDADDLDRAFDLIKADANLAALNEWGWTMLRNCLSYEMVEQLILHGADPNQADKKGKTVWMTGAPELLEFIEQATRMRDWLALADATPQTTVGSLRRL